MDTQISLGQIQNFQHEQRLLEVAYWLDQNKFSCTMVIVDGLAHYDITTHKDQLVLEIVINALCRKLSEV